jgi:serine/threonine-protein kinase
VKPSNIVMSAPPRLIDLSIARSFEDAAALRNPIGTDAYMAPEQCARRTRGVIGPPADVFGLGATVFHAAVGKAPFTRGKGASKSEVPEERWPQLVNDPIPMHRDVPPRFGQLLLAMIDKDPQARPTAAEVALQLEPLVATLPTRVFATHRGLRAG